MSACDPKRTYASGSYAFPLGAQSVPIHQLTRTPAHFPEFNFEPRGFFEDRNQLGLAGGRRIGIGKALQMRPRFRRDRLVGRTGIFGDPLAIGVRFGKRLGPRGKPRRGPAGESERRLADREVVAIAQRVTRNALAVYRNAVRAVEVFDDR